MVKPSLPHHGPSVLERWHRSFHPPNPWYKQYRHQHRCPYSCFRRTRCFFRGFGIFASKGQRGLTARALRPGDSCSHAFANTPIRFRTLGFDSSRSASSGLRDRLMHAVSAKKGRPTLRWDGLESGAGWKSRRSTRAGWWVLGKPKSNAVAEATKMVLRTTLIRERKRSDRCRPALSVQGACRQ